jgi:hypothetical protein
MESGKSKSQGCLKKILKLIEITVNWIILPSISRVLCAVEGKYLVQETCYDLMDGAATMNEHGKPQCLNFQCSVPNFVGRGFIEVLSSAPSLSWCFCLVLVLQHEWFSIKVLWSCFLNIFSCLYCRTETSLLQFLKSVAYFGPNLYNFMVCNRVKAWDVPVNIFYSFWLPNMYQLWNPGYERLFSLVLGTWNLSVIDLESLSHFSQKEADSLFVTSIIRVCVCEILLIYKKTCLADSFTVLK